MVKALRYRVTYKYNLQVPIAFAPRNSSYISTSGAPPGDLSCQQYHKRAGSEWLTRWSRCFLPALRINLSEWTMPRSITATAGLGGRRRGSKWLIDVIVAARQPFIVAVIILAICTMTSGVATTPPDSACDPHNQRLALLSFYNRCVGI